MELADKQYQPVTGDQKIKLDDRLAVQERARRELSARLAKKEKEAEYLQAALVEHQQGIQQMSDQLWEIYGSTAWKLVKLLWRVRLALLPHGSWTEKQVRRLFKRGALVESPVQVIRESEAAPVRNQFVSSPNGKAAFDTRYSDAYKRMLAVATNQADEEYVGLSESDFSSVEAAVKLIAFYLPQFHPFPENDAWWGKGFTEWTNVSKAVPQFLGHYQPHLPGELGFYDLRVPEVQRRQVELAKQYGLHGFCFHYYWFNGKRLLERPLDQFIADPEIDFPFCLCWANENWTRRWDGQENDMLIEQVYSEESDYAFIRDILPYLQHKNYIKVDGRPVLIVYRASMIPDPQATIRRWNEYCVTQGVPEPYLIAAQTFSFYDPREIYFDAAVEFPPHNYPPVPVNDQKKILNSKYEGNICDYADIVSALDNDAVPYKLYRTVFPGWDNEPRKPGKGYIFASSSPQLYKSWLSKACYQTIISQSPDERLVFINAWNEWGEGAYLEPDRRYGYAYLQSTADVLRALSTIEFNDLRTAFKDFALTTITKRSDTAVILHLFYPDLWEEMDQYLQNIVGDFDLYVSIPSVVDFPVERILSKYPGAFIYSCENRGRDILPFIKIFNAICFMGYKYICKFHTKKSSHREDGINWRRDLLNKLLGSSQTTAKIKKYFDEKPMVGVVAPAGHLVPMEYYMAFNEGNILKLTSRLNMPLDMNTRFVAGSMFWFKPSALFPLLSLNLNEVDFEEEMGQKDGTLAHAIERLISLITSHYGYISVEINEEADITVPVDSGKPEYVFAVATNRMAL